MRTTPLRKHTARFTWPLRSTTIDTTQSFLRKVFLGERFPDIDDWLEQTLSERYGGSSRKAVLVAYRDALKRWCSMMED